MRNVAIKGLTTVGRSVLRADASQAERWFWFAVVVSVVSAVSDGWSGKPSPLVHQILLLPALLLVLIGLRRVLGSGRSYGVADNGKVFEAARLWGAWLLVFEGASVALFVAEAHHFRAFGYRASTATWLALSCGLVALWSASRLRTQADALRAGLIFGAYALGVLVAIQHFPLNYLRSDMLPVIVWADGRLLQHLDPYASMQVGSRVYDFPYLPGMLVAFVPAVAAHADVRFANLVYMAGVTALVYGAARRDRKLEVTTLLGLFLLCPFLQYRHDIYLEPHWFTLVLAVVLMQRKRYGWSALVWGASCAVYQLSWVLLPFVLLASFRRRGIPELLKSSMLALTGALGVAGPFLRFAARRMAHNTVGQWSRLPHALADPINLSYWMTYLVRPDRLMWLQAVTLTALFGFCVQQRRCQTLEDTLRWMSWALALFIALNVLVDGYFYLTLLLLLMLYTCVANDWWEQPAPHERLPVDQG